MSGLILAIDGGSQSTKLSLVDRRGVVRRSARVGLRPLTFPAPGHAVHPADDLWDSLVAACRELGDLSDVVAVGLCSIRFCRAYLREDGALAEPVLSWMDARVDGPPELTNDIRWVTTASGYLTARLTGQLRDTVANYAGFWPVAGWGWSNDPADFERTGMPRERLFDLVHPGDLLGHVGSQAAAATGISEGTAVFATANDKAVEALGAGLLSPGPLLLSLGTYIATMRVVENHGEISIGWTNFHCVPQRRLLESDGIRRGMWTVSWLAESLSTDLSELNAGAAEVPAGSDGLITVLDWLAPGSHPHRRGSILGFTAAHTKYHLYRSVLEGICLTMADHADAVERSLELPAASPLILTGGGSRSELMLQIAADVFDRPAIRMEQPDAAGLGAAICAAVGHGWYDDWASAAAAMVRVEREVRPSHARAAYRLTRARHAAARSGLDDLYRALPEL